MSLQDDVRKSLSSLERTLKEIQSAKEQVVSLSGAAEDFRKQTKELFEALEKFEKKVDGDWTAFIGQLKKTTEEVETSVGSSLGRLDSSAEAFEKIVEKASKDFERLSSIEQKIDDQAETLKSLAVLQENLSKVKNNLKEVEKGFSNQLSLNQKRIEEVATTLTSVVKAQESHADQLKDTHTAINNQFTELENSIKEQSDALGAKLAFQDKLMWGLVVLVLISIVLGLIP